MKISALEKTPNENKRLEKTPDENMRSGEHA
jgi:hypothetical protein